MVDQSGEHTCVNCGNSFTWHYRRITLVNSTVNRHIVDADPGNICFNIIGNKVEFVISCPKCSASDKTAEIELVTGIERE